MRGQPRADAQVCGDDAFGYDARDVDNLGIAQDRDIARFLRLAGRIFENGLSDLPPRLARKVGIAELENSRAEPEGLLVRPDIPELYKREQKPSRGGTGQTGFRSRFAQRERGALGSECLDDG